MGRNTRNPTIENGKQMDITFLDTDYVDKED